MLHFIMKLLVEGMEDGEVKGPRTDTTCEEFCCEEEHTEMVLELEGLWGCVPFFFFFFQMADMTIYLHATENV